MKYIDKEILNDYELIDVIRSGDLEARELMITKYLPLIRKVSSIYKYSEYEDMTQFGMMIVNNAIDKYDCKYNKTFTKYIQLILTRSFQRAYYSRKPIVYLENDVFESMFAEEEVSEYKLDYDMTDIKLQSLSKLEKEIILFYSENKKMSPKLIEKHGKKTIYNAFYRAKKKLSKYLTKPLI